MDDVVQEDVVAARADAVEHGTRPVAVRALVRRLGEDGGERTGLEQVHARCVDGPFEVDGSAEVLLDASAERIDLEHAVLAQRCPVPERGRQRLAKHPVPSPHCAEVL